MEDSKGINCDLLKERKTATFNVEDLTNILDGSKRRTDRRRKILSQVFSNPVFDMKDKHYQDIPTRYDAAIQRTAALMELAVENAWSQDDLRHVATALRFELPISVHAVMFLPVIERLGTDEQQEEWLPRAARFEMIGTYAQTELGHGTNVRNLETTAIFDQASDEFVLNTPLPSGMKWWPGGLGKAANHAVVLAQCMVNGKNKGIQAFMVQLRDLDSHLPLPGVELGDIGPKIGLNMADNGFLILRNLRIPRTNMLMKYIQVDRQGNVVRGGAERANYGTMMLVRANIVYGNYQYLAQAVTIATRYAAVRHQSELIPNAPEPQIMEYQTQQYKLFPSIALAYAIFFAKEYMITYYEKVYENEIQQGNFQSVPELHSQSSGLKSYTADLMTEAIEICRRSCGGHGYLLQSGLCDLYGDSLASCTYEGENTVLYLQVARFLMKAVQTSKTGSRLGGSTAYLLSSPVIPQIKNKQVLLDPTILSQLFNRRAFFIVHKIAEKLQQDLASGKAQHHAWNENSVDLVYAAKVHCDSFVAINFISNIENLRMNKNTPPEILGVLTTLSQLHALHRIMEGKADFLECGALTPEQIDVVRNMELNLLKGVRPNAVALVDAFDWRDETLGSTIGCFDGNVYEKMLAMSKRGPMNKFEVAPSIMKYMKAFTKKFQVDSKL